MTMAARDLEDFPARLRLVRSLLLERCGTAEKGRRAAALVQRIEERLQRPPRIVLLGETNSGKSTLANRLLQRELLTTDILLNTRVPVLVRHGPVAGVHIRSLDGPRHLLSVKTAPQARLDDVERVEVSVPLTVLQDFELLDLPGLSTEVGAIDRARRQCATAHMAIWCTVASQAWKASELGLWRALSKRFGGASLLAVTHADGLSVADRDKVMKRLERDAAPLFRSIVMVSDEPRLNEGIAATDTEPVDVLAVVRAAAAGIQAQRYKRAGAVVRKFAERMTRGARERRAESVQTV